MTSAMPPASPATDSRPFTGTLAAGAIGGLVAGLVLGLLLIAFVSPIIGVAEQFEGHGAGASSQRQVGTLVGSILLGTVCGLAASAAYAPLARRSKRGWLTLGLGLGGAAFVLLHLTPALMGTLNPPAVEELPWRLIADFRHTSLLVFLAFWVLLGVVVARLKTAFAQA